MLRLAVLLCVAVVSVYGHGRFIEPPSRGSAWRFGFDTPVNYNDNELFCGGFNNQWFENDGKCGVCGDPYQGPWPHEAGGRYATGTIVRSYKKGQVIDVESELTTNHKGWFEFRICAVNDHTVKATQECLDENLLEIADGSGTRLPIYTGMRDVKLQLKLPDHLTCSQCVIQWKYHSGNRWGVDPETGIAATGNGPQEEFYGCADVSIA